MHLSACKGCMSFSTAFRDCVSDCKRVIYRVSFKYLVVTNLLEVAKNIFIACEMF
jgi:hypothetical protein